jgi:hypothetical protein
VNFERNGETVEAGVVEVASGFEIIGEVLAAPLSHSDELKVQKELDSIIFYIENDYDDLAEKALAGLARQYGDRPEFLELRRKIGAELEVQSAPAVPEQPTIEVVGEEFVASGLGISEIRNEFGIDSGGTTGRGFGLGFPEVIPIADSDYVYAAIAEETGLMGGAVIILAIIIFVVAGVRTSLEARDMFTKLCAAGLTALVGFQALVNIGGILRALPMTGITLPFVSHGGFSLITSFAMLGMLMAFSNRNARDRVVLDRPVAKSSSPLKLEAVQ